MREGSGNGFAAVPAEEPGTYSGPLYARAQRLLHLRVAEGRNLKGGKSSVSTYCNVDLGGGLVVRTQTVRRSANPTYGEDLNFELPLSWEPGVAVDVFEERSKGRDVFLGRVSLDAQRLEGSRVRMQQEWLPLVMPTTKRKDFVSGSIYVTLRYAPKQPESDKPGSLEIKVGEARNLTQAGYSGPCKPFVRVDFGGAMQASDPARARTSVSLRFDDAFAFPAEKRGNRTVIISVWHSRKMGSDVFMGEVSIDLRALEPYVPHGAWYSLRSKYYATERAKIELSVQREVRKRRASVSLGGAPPPSSPSSLASSSSSLSGRASPGIVTPRDEDLAVRSSFETRALGGSALLAESPEVAVRKRALTGIAESLPREEDESAPPPSVLGDLRIKYEFSEIDILPLDAYEGLLVCLEEEECVPARWVMAETRNRDAFARSLMMTLRARESAVGMLIRVLVAEVERTPNTAVLFRGNSLGSKAMDAYMKVVGARYLKDTLSPVLDRVFADESVRYEIDADRAERSGSDPEANLVALDRVVRLALDAIVESLDEMPMMLRVVFQALAAAVAEQFPEEPEAEMTAVSGFLFLRFFCPAIMGPKVFGLADTHPVRHMARGFVLIAKTIQAAANLVRFGDKEKCMVLLNPVLEDYDERIREFLHLAACPPETLGVSDVEGMYGDHERPLDKAGVEHQAALVHKEITEITRGLSREADIVEMWPGVVRSGPELMAYTGALLRQLDKIRVQAKTITQRRERGLSVWHAQHAEKGAELHDKDTWSDAKEAELARIRTTMETGAVFVRHANNKKSRRFVYADFDKQSLYWEPVSKRGPEAQPRSCPDGSRIAFPDILDVVRGHTTVAFQKTGKRGREFVAFSVVALFCTLDLEAESEHVREEWFDALSFVVDEVNVLLDADH